MKQILANVSVQVISNKSWFVFVEQEVQELNPFEVRLLRMLLITLFSFCVLWGFFVHLFTFF